MNQPRSAAEPELVPATQHVAENSKWSNFETVFTNAKAGMSGVDKDHIKRVVYEMSKVSQGIHSSLYAGPAILSILCYGTGLTTL